MGAPASLIPGILCILSYKRYSFIRGQGKYCIVIFHKNNTFFFYLPRNLMVSLMLEFCCLIPILLIPEDYIQ